MNRRSNTSCLTEQEIEEFLFNRLSGVTREAVEEHLLVCQSCLDRVEKEEDYFSATRTAARVMEGEDLDRAFAGSARPEQPKGWRARLARWFGAGRSRTLTVALASIAVVGMAVLFQVRVGRHERIQDVSLELHRGALASAEAVAGVDLRLTLQADEFPAGVYRVDIVDASGKLLQTSHAIVQSGKLVWPVNRSFPAGRYWVRLRQPGSSGGLLREYGLVLR